MLEILRRTWVRQLGGENANSFLIDTKPIPVMGYRRSKQHRDFSGSAGADAMRPSRALRKQQSLRSKPERKALLHDRAWRASWSLPPLPSESRDSRLVCQLRACGRCDIALPEK